MKINELSELTGISKRNIHFYIKQGMITPMTDANSGYYDFSKRIRKGCVLSGICEK